jgi:hypothetical protein
LRFEVLIVVKIPVLGLLASALKMEAVCSSETLVCTYKPTQCSFPEVQQQVLSFCIVDGTDREIKPVTYLKSNIQETVYLFSITYECIWQLQISTYG